MLALSTNLCYICILLIIDGRGELNQRWCVRTIERVDIIKKQYLLDGRGTMTYWMGGRSVMYKYSTYDDASLACLLSLDLPSHHLLVQYCTVCVTGYRYRTPDDGPNP